MTRTPASYIAQIIRAARRVKDEDNTPAFVVWAKIFFDNTDRNAEISRVMVEIDGVINKIISQIMNDETLKDATRSNHLLILYRAKELFSPYKSGQNWSETRKLLNTNIGDSMDMLDDFLDGRLECAQIRKDDLQKILNHLIDLEKSVREARIDKFIRKQLLIRILDLKASIDYIEIVGPTKFLGSSIDLLSSAAELKDKDKSQENENIISSIVKLARAVKDVVVGGKEFTDAIGITDDNTGIINLLN